MINDVQETVDVTQEVEDIITSSVEAMSEPIFDMMNQILSFAMVLAVFLIAILFVKFIIVKSIRKIKEKPTDVIDKTNLYGESNKTQKRYLDDDHLELFRLYCKLSDNDKILIKAKIVEMLRVKA
jgi:flagellar biosynthesis/type III secretory pathway M-ring protein FliF/YscJ